MASFAQTPAPQQISVSVNGKFGTVSLRELRSQSHTMVAKPLNECHSNSTFNQVEPQNLKQASRQSTEKTGTGFKRMIDRSGDLPHGIGVKDVLGPSLGIMEASELSSGCNVTKFGSKGGPRQRRVYFNFSDGTMRLTHSVPLFQSFMSENKGIFFLYSCYKPHCLR